MSRYLRAMRIIDERTGAMKCCACGDRVARELLGPDRRCLGVGGDDETAQGAAQ
jgi:hypothetical protein